MAGQGRGKKINKLKKRTPPPPCASTSPPPPPLPCASTLPPPPRASTPPPPPRASTLPPPPPPRASRSPPPPRASTSPPQQQASHPQSHQDQETTPDTHVAYDFLGKKRKHGKSCGKAVQHLIEANGGKTVPVIFETRFQVPDDGKMGARLSSEIGNIVRTYAPVCYMGWHNVPLDDKRRMRESLLVQFGIDLSDQKILTYVNKKMQKLYSQFKYRLHKHYKGYNTPAQGRANVPHNDLWNGRPENHWHWLCDEVYASADFKEVSRINAENRKHQKYHHRGGAKPFIQHARKTQKGKPLSMIDNFEKLHTNGDVWVNDVAKKKHEEMKLAKDMLREKKIQEAPEGTQPDSIVVDVEDEFQILGETLGRKGRSIRGVGVFPQMEASNSYVASSKATTSELNEMKEKLNELSTNFVNMQKENEELKAQLRAFMEAPYQRSRFRVEQDGRYYDDELGEFSDDSD